MIRATERELSLNLYDRITRIWSTSPNIYLIVTIIPRFSSTTL